MYHRIPVPLLWAAEGRHHRIIELLTDWVFKADEDLLYLAAQKGHDALCHMLLTNCRLDVNWKAENRTALFDAAMYGHEAVVRLLLATSQIEVDVRCLVNNRVGPRSVVDFRKGLDSFTNMTRTPLFQAARFGHESVVRLLLETREVDVDIQDENGDTPLLYAIAGAGELGTYKEITKLLLENDMAGINVENKDGETPLTLAVCRGQEDMVKLLLETGKITLHLADLHEDTRLSHALRSFKFQFADDLVQGDEQAEDWDKRYDNINSLLHRACSGKHLVTTPACCGRDMDSYR